MPRNANPYTWAGVGLLILGFLITTVALLIFDLTWLMALGLATLIIALLLLALGRSVPRLPPEFGRLLMEAGIDNIASVVEELGIREKAVYLPSSLAGGRPRALLPLASNDETEWQIKSLPQRFIVRYGAAPEQVGLLVSTPGTLAVAMLASTPGTEVVEIEAALKSLLVGTLGLAGGIRVIGLNDGLRVEIDRPSVGQSDSLGYQLLGGPLASVSAAVVAEGKSRPVAITGEKNLRRRHIVELQVF